MEIIYTIHSNLEHCSVSVNNIDYSYYSLKQLLKPRSKEFLKKTKLKEKTYSVEINDIAEKFEKSNLTQDEIKDYFFRKKESKAKSWFSSQRSLRKKGKLEKRKIDALNKIGMLWNPSKDEWEKNYSLFQNQPLAEILREMKRKNYYVSLKDVNNIIYLDKWVVEQNQLYSESKLSEENLVRLKAINFPFNINLEYDNNNEFKLTSLISFILRIDELSRMGAEYVAKRYYLKQKVYVGGNVRINEKEILSTHKKELIDYEKESHIEDKYFFKFEKEHKSAQENAVNILNEKPPEYFIKQIDKISKKYTPSWNDKNIYEVDKKGKDRLSLLYFDKYTDKYKKLKSFLDNNFNFPKIKIDKTVYEATYGKYNYSDRIKIYAAKKMIVILDDHLLKTGMLNDKKVFKPISFLLKTFHKDKNIRELITLKELIENHQLLSLIYLEKLNKILNRYV